MPVLETADKIIFLNIYYYYSIHTFFNKIKLILCMTQSQNQFYYRDKYWCFRWVERLRYQLGIYDGI